MILNSQGFDSLCAHDAFVKVSGDFGVDFPDFMVHGLQLFLENSKEKNQQRNSGENHQGKLGVHFYHHKHRADEVRNTPGAVNEPPADQTADTACVTHQPGMDVAHAVLVEIGEREGLKVLETGLPKFPVYLHFYDGCL